MLKSNALKIAALQNLATAQDNNASATRGLAREQSRTNKLLEENLETKDRVDISMREYKDLLHKKDVLANLTAVISTMLEKSGLTLEEFSNIKPEFIKSYFDENPAEFSLRLILTADLKDLQMRRVRELLQGKVLK